MTDEELMAAALAAQGRAYAPYSHFRVGAAVLAGGRVYGGANVENASYGLALCAERSAVARAVFDGARTIDVVAVASDASPPAPPCGMCLQTLAEFSPDFAETRVLLGNAGGVHRSYTLAELLPHGFKPSDLARTVHGATEPDGRDASSRRSDEGAGSPPATEERRPDAQQIGRQATEAHELSGRRTGQRKE